MGFILSEEQQFLQDSAKDLFKNAAPVAKVRELRDSNDETAYAEGLWKSMSEMGWAGTCISEEYGGIDFGYRGLGLLFEEGGRTLSASPLLSNVLSAHLIQSFGSDEVKSAYLPGIAEGSSKVSIAIQEKSHYSAREVESTHMNGLVNGKKKYVMDGHVADFFLVSARSAEASDDKKGIDLVLVSAKSEGITVTKDKMMDSRFYCEVEFDNVKVNHLVGEAGSGYKALAKTADVANILLSAELLGIMSEAFERTVEYLKERRQFDKVIGSFQGLQHRAADMYGEIEVCKSLVIMALDAIDGDSMMLPGLASMAKARCSKYAQIITNEGIQMFGGIGMTDDEEIGFFMKRSRVAEQLFGGRTYHLDRYAKLSGY